MGRQIQSRKIILFVAAFLIWGSLRTVDAADEASADRAGSTIRGKIVDGNGKPVAGASVSLYRYKDSPSERWGRWEVALKPIETDVQGRFQLSAGSASFVLVSTEANGFARGFVTRSLQPNESVDIQIMLAKPATAAIEVTDEAGRPVEGARVRSFVQRGVNGEFSMPQLWMRSLDLKCPSSDARGRLLLPAFPQGDTLKVTVEHPRMAPLRIDEVPVKDGTAVKGTMKPGVVLTLRQVEGAAENRISSATLDLRHDRSDAARTGYYEIDFDANGVAQLTVEPGPYQFLRLQHDDFYLTPTYMREGGKTEKLEIAAGKNDDLRFDIRRRIDARGRVVDAETGVPVSGASLLGEIASFEGEALIEAEKWSFTGWGETDANGNYTLPISAGRARVSFHGDQRIAESTHLEFEAAADGSTVIPDIRARRIPKIVGTVEGADGKPVSRAVVRLRGKSVDGLQPVATDAEGHFEIQPEWIPFDEDIGQPDFTQFVVAFDPLRPLAAVAEVRLDKPERLRMTLEPTPADWPLTAIAEEINDWQRGIVPADVAERNARISLKGKTAPELDGIGWINSEPLRLADLRGKYVLIDFWFTGCGPCHYEFPSVKLVHEAYKDHGVVVIGVHNNSRSLEAVREHVKKVGLTVPVMVDHPDGRTVAKYEPHGIPEAYPCYVLIDPEGNVLLDDRTIPSRSLRANKLEIIRKFLLDR